MNNMAKQMEMFQDGGLMDEGGTVDPVSGNDVPPGSNQEEVRDDIPAQLSEGEFVFPADVVRFIGLEKLMKIRQRAKAGLQRMEDMGQMGNSEEAVMPDDLPFSIEDLDIEDEEEYNTPQEFNVGGMATANPATYNVPDPAAGVYYNNPVQNYNPPEVAAPVQAASYMPANFGPNMYNLQQAPTPVMQPPKNLPPFLGGVVPGVGGVDYTEETYVNEAGNIIKFRRYNDGSLKDSSGNEAVIPEGYTIKSEADKDVGTGPVKVETATVQDDGGDRQDYGGGTSLLTGEKIAGYSPEEIKSGVAAAKDRYAITGNRGIDLLSIIPGGSFIKSIMPDASMSIFGTDPVYTGRPDDSLMNAQQTARDQLQASLGTRITGYVGFQKGDLDPNSGGFFDKNGIAVDPRTGDQTKNESGTMNYSSFNDWKEAFAAGTKSGWRGGKLGAESYSGLSEKAKANYDKFADIMGYDDHKAKTEDAKTKTDKGYPSGVTQRDFDKETASEAAAREAANKAQAERQQAARDERDNSDRDDGVGESDGGGYGSDAGTGGGGDMGVICLTEDMKVKRNGVVDFVTNVKVGDIVDNTVVTEVLHKHMREGYYVVNGELKITNDHPVLANGSWKRTEDLVLGDYINSVEVTSIKYVEQVTPTVYIGTADDRYDVYTEGEVYTVHGQYKNGLKKAA